MQDTAIDLGPEYNDLTDRQRRFVGMAARHADDFATRAAEHDRDGTFPFENFTAMHESGYARICLPAEFEGEDADLEEFCLAQERLAQGCSSTALSANMHGFATGTWAERWRQGITDVEVPMRLVAEGGITLGGSVSEAESADPFNAPAGRIERVEGGYKLNGRKVFGSNTPVNPIVTFNGICEQDGARTVMLFNFPKELPGVTVVEDWDVMGMRATGSYTIEFRDCIVPDAFPHMEWEAGGLLADHPFGGPFVCWFGPSIGAVYTGIAVAARNYVRNAVADRSRLPNGPLKHYPSVQYAVGEMYICIEASRAMVRRTARRLSDPGWRDADALALAAAAKHLATENARRVADLAMETGGAGTFFKRSPLERMYRDVRAGGFHPLPRYDAYEAIGKAELKIPDNITPRFL